MSYFWLTLAVPDNPSQITTTAKQAMRALDPDSGGYNAFQTKATKGGANYLVYGFPCDQAMQDLLVNSKSDSTALYNRIVSDPRWSQQSQPTQSSLNGFCNAVLISTAWGTAAGMAELGMA